MRLFKLAIAPVIHKHVACGLVVMLGACASNSPDPHASKEPTRLDLSIAAAKDVNPDDKRRPAPIVVRVYELKNDSTFKSEDFFSLQDKDKTVLSDDLTVRDEFLLRPGDTKAIRRKSDPATTVIGVLAAYRDLPNAVWRATYELPLAPATAWYRSGNRIKLNIDLGADAIKVTERK
ncbi:type VI secretion system lipoprotein TssJ [Paraburkholderia nemoris]|jgi:type VI secretion system protein VasD|uniref:type VI secretion system lipoprotein TssJ n=1 Tax=Paraburkholderia nemoris TaxID=2793076 RepID=UPI001B0AD960|nr:type VI secretion system lipoprotein TssJ [Paraburkholderia nemoris]CAE6848775.1 hypothetical protein LMG22931_07599 [Paraburkholderia nemoris]